MLAISYWFLLYVIHCTKCSVCFFAQSMSDKIKKIFIINRINKPYSFEQHIKLIMFPGIDGDWCKIQKNQTRLKKSKNMNIKKTNYLLVCVQKRNQNGIKTQWLMFATLEIPLCVSRAVHFPRCRVKAHLSILHTYMLEMNKHKD